MATAVVQDLLDRRVPQYVALYIGISWGVVEFFAFLEDRFLLSPHWTNLTLLLAALLLPSVALFTYFHGRPGADRWARLEKLFIPTNVVVTLAILFFVFSGKDLGAVTATVVVEDEEGNTVERVVPKSEFRKSVALFVPAADTTDEDSAWLGYGFYNGLVNDLYQDMFLDLRPSALYRSELREAGYGSDAAAPLALKRQVTREGHVPHFVDGRVDRTEAGFRVTLSLHDTERGRVVQERVHEGPDLLALIDSASLQLRRDLELPTRHIEETPDVGVAEHTTSSVEALRHYAVGMAAFLERDDYPNASAGFRAALEADPTFADAAYTLYNMSILMGDVQSAVPALQVAMDNLYRLPERTHYQIKGEWYAIQRDLPKAFAVYEMWAELYPQDLNALAAVGQIRLIQDDRPGAIEAYESILELNPARIDLLPQIGNLYREVGEPDRARAYYERHLDEAPESVSTLRALARLARDEGDHDETRALLERALLVEPEDVQLMISLAALDEAVGRFDDALEGFERAVAAARTAEQRAPALNALRDHHRGRGQLRTALQYHERALAELGTYAPPLLALQTRLMGLDLYVEAGQPEPALGQLNALAAQLQPPLDAVIPMGRMNLFEAMERVDDLSDAVEAAEATIQNTGATLLEGPTLHYRGRLHELRGEWRDAIAAYERARASNPTESSIPYRLGRCYRELRELERAEALIGETLTVTPYSGRANYEMGLTLEQAGRAADAATHFERALEVWAPADPDFVWAERAREALARVRG